MFADLSTHLTWLRRFALEKTVPHFPIGGPICLGIEVESGLMAGTSTRLVGENILIGSGPDCAVQLLDDGVADEHFSLRLHNSIFGTLAEVTAHEATTIALDEPLMPGSASGLLRLPLTVSIGKATLRISSPNSSASARIFSRYNAAFAVLIVVISLAIFLIVNQLVRAAQIDFVAATVLQAPIQEPHTRPDSADFSAKVLGDLGLATDVTILDGEGGSLIAAGNVPMARWQQWRDFRTWYDQQPDMPILLSSVTMAPVLVDLRPIASIQLHEPATVFFAIGQSAKVGDTLEEGWTLTAIDATGLTLERSNEITRIRF